jgi:hypothetical protein
MAVIYCRSVIVKFTLLGMRYLTQMNWELATRPRSGQLSDAHVIEVPTAVAPQPPQNRFEAVWQHISLRLPVPSPPHSSHGPSFKTCTLPKPFSLLRCPSKPATSKSPLWPTPTTTTPTKTPVAIEPSTASSQRTSTRGTNAPRNDLAQGVATGAIGAGYGPYSVRLSSSLQF